MPSSWDGPARGSLLGWRAVVRGTVKRWRIEVVLGLCVTDGRGGAASWHCGIVTIGCRGCLVEVWQGKHSLHAARGDEGYRCVECETGLSLGGVLLPRYCTTLGSFIEEG